MLSALKTNQNYHDLRNRLKPSQLTLDELNQALKGIAPDTVAGYVSRFLDDEVQERQRGEKLTWILSGIGLIFWVMLTTSGSPGRLEFFQWVYILLGPLIVVLSFCLAARRFRPLRHNALSALTTVVQDVHERESIPTLCRIASHLNGSRRSWETEIEAATRSTLARILTRLSDDDVALLPQDVHDFLLQAIADNSNYDLTVVALLVLGSARESQVAPLAEELLSRNIPDRVREAAEECRAELCRSA